MNENIETKNKEIIVPAMRKDKKGKVNYYSEY